MRIKHPKGETDDRRHGRQGDIALREIKRQSQYLLALPKTSAHDAGIRERGGIRACAGSGQGEAGDLIPTGKPRQVVVLLRLGAVMIEQLGRTQ